MDKQSQEAIKNIFEKYRLCKYLKHKGPEYNAYCELIESAVNSLPSEENFLITQRYLAKDGDYLSDGIVYKYRFNPPISDKTYSKIRDKAFEYFAKELQTQ